MSGVLGVLQGKGWCPRCPPGKGLVANAFPDVPSDDDMPFELFLAEPLPTGFNLVRGLESALATD